MDDVTLRGIVTTIVGQPVRSLDPIPGAGGYTPAIRRAATLADGTAVFVKAAVDDGFTRGALAAEIAAYAAIGERAFAPTPIGGSDDVLVLPDLRRAHWPLPWREGDIDRAKAMLAELAIAPAPAALPTLEQTQGFALRAWSDVAREPTRLLALALCSPQWLDLALPLLLEAEGRGALEGDALVHADVRSDNICLLDATKDGARWQTGDGHGVLLVDWNNACRGRPDFDAVCFAETVAAETGRSPDELLPDADPALVVMVAGYFAANAPLPIIAAAPRGACPRNASSSGFRATVRSLARTQRRKPP